MGLFSFVKEWSGQAGKINESDKAIEFLTGLNPKHLHPELYKNNLKFPAEAASGLVPDTDYGTPDLTSDETTALRLAMLLTVYDKHEEFSSAQRFADGLGRLLRTRGAQIRSEIVEVINEDVCYGVRTRDSNPQGLRR